LPAGEVLGNNRRQPQERTLDHYVDHIEHVANLIGIDGVGVRFDFFELSIANGRSRRKKELAEKFATPNSFPI
jgi:microsomal dipeptidase-like Zn-dependent dipeptidase